MEDIYRIDWSSSSFVPLASLKKELHKSSLYFPSALEAKKEKKKKGKSKKCACCQWDHWSSWTFEGRLAHCCNESIISARQEIKNQGAGTRLPGAMVMSRAWIWTVYKRLCLCECWFDFVSIIVLFIVKLMVSRIDSKSWKVPRLCRLFGGWCPMKESLTSRKKKHVECRLGTQQLSIKFVAHQ